jgi:hypothetical protein
MNNQAGKNRGATAPVQNNVQHNIGQQHVGEYTSEFMLFGSFVECLTDFELKFLVHHYNAGLPLGRSVSVDQLKLFPINEIIPFIKSINVGIIGQSVVDCINAKLATKQII